MSRATVGLGIAAFALACALRLLNLPFAAISPADELYHWKRIEFSAQHFPQVLELDRDRGVNGAFCPWPPLYDLSAGVVARTLGMKSVLWIPPVAGAAAVALAAMCVMSTFGPLAGAAAAIALAASPFIVTQSWIGAIDHHYLEWPLVFGIMIATAPHPPFGHLLPARGEKAYIGLGVAMIAALFVQTALIIACGLAFVVPFIRGERKASGAFFASAAIVAIYRLTRSPAYPNSAWFLGWPHVTLLIAAGVALLVRPRLVGLGVGALIALAAPIGQGLTFFGGDRWLQTIVEFQPMWRSHGADLVSQIFGLSIGAILIWKLVRDRPAIALFAITFLVLTIINRRFWSVSIPLLAIGGAICAASFANRRARFASAAAVALIPAMQLIAWMRYPQRPIERYQVAWIAAAKFLRTQPPGRVLGQWALGHTMDVIARHPVIIDGFGTMPDSTTFERAYDAMTAPDEATLARYCDEAHVRYVVLDDPEFGLETAAKILGLRDLKKQSTWYWRAYYGNISTPRFREIYRSDPSFYRAAIVIWEYAGHA